MRLPTLPWSTGSFLSLLLLPLALVSAEEHSSYDENLLLRTLPGNSVLASFRFVSNGTFNSHHSVFPRSLAQILQHSQTKELHLKFTLGRWDAERWGSQIWDGRTAGGTGVELWAWVEAGSDAEADARWTTLNNALSGLFCASLNFIDSTRTIRPVMSFQPDGHHAEDIKERLHLLHGTLPREPVCTENLTPFLKLLPCKGKAGISSLLDGHKLFDAKWQSMSIDVTPVCEEIDGVEKCQLQMVQTVDMVLDVERSLRKKDSVIPRPPHLDQMICDPNKFYSGSDSCFPLDDISDLSWSLSEMFGRPIRGSCPLASLPTSQSINVCANVPDQRAIYVSAGGTEVGRGDNIRCFILEENTDFDIILPDQSPAILLPNIEPPLYASRSFTGHGQERGGVQAVLRNPSPDRHVEFVYLESLPWFMKPYLHTFSATLDPPIETQWEEKIIQEIYYRPALDRRRGTQLEARMRIPPNSTVLVTYDFDKAVLRYTEYPPDANRGFDIAPAIISILAPRNSQTIFSIRTTSLLLSLPTPDFSMPYNVIILTSTVMALAFGTVFNLLVRRFVGADESVRMNPVQVLKVKIMAAVKRIKAKRERSGKAELAKKNE
ncbi:Gpi16 subunit, GPI transamidase component [Morchella conica CCBAS932]|uniref:Gpi16 subunit, GPI transamidase component n=1 Tax=Morchella conica CCBAS932 TaxID=1392247 RepID=A0A3N4L0N8_9PEZI|nr:Gpi16 subunit, GPI transamidase component [Morchella conica CCBAS932]